MSLYSWLTYFAMLLLLSLQILCPKEQSVSENPPPPLLKTADFYFILDTRPNENPALKINFSPVNTAQSNNLIAPLELNHIEFSTLAYYCKGYPNEWSNFDVASGNASQETRFFNFKPGKSFSFRINTVSLIPTDESYIISQRTIIFRNIEPSTIKAIENTYDSYLVRNASK